MVLFIIFFLVNNYLVVKAATAEEFLKTGDDYTVKYNYAVAITAYSQAIELNPNYCAAYINRGMAYSTILMNDLAIADYSKVIRLEPNRTEHYKRRIKFLEGLTQYKSTHDYNKVIMILQDYSEMIELEPNNVDNYRERAEIYKKVGQLDMVILDYNRIIELEPDVIDNYRRRAELYEKNDQNNMVIQDYSKIIEFYNKKIQSDPYNGRLLDQRDQSYKQRGDFYTKMGQSSLADADYKMIEVAKKEKEEIYKEFFLGWFFYITTFIIPCITILLLIIKLIKFIIKSIRK